jgi:hypothetical protein
MVSSGMLRRVALVRTDGSRGLRCSEKSVLTRATRRNIPEDNILPSHRRENLKSYIGNIYFYKVYKIWGFHFGDYKEWRILECDAMWRL